MTDRIRGRTNRVRTPVLPVFLGSDAPVAFKAEAQEILSALAPYPTLDEAVLRDERPDLLTRMAALTAAGLDLLRVLRGEEPRATTVSRQNVAASLREKWRELGDALDASAYPAGHIVPLMAQVYWGSIAAWIEARLGRAYRPKGYWRQRGNQLAALRDYAARHPDWPVTHAALHAAGLHAFATATSAAELDALAQELGLGRNLRQKPDGHWTPEATVDAYAALCRAGGGTLSSSQLAALGGVGFTIRGRAVQLFGRFHPFQAAACRRHPDLKPPTRATATDGTLLDSQQEVIVYDALRVVLPSAEVAVHVLLPIGNGRRSCDFVVGSRVYVEVLGLSAAEMQAPRSERQRKYAAQWKAKRPLYRELGVPLVVFEPEDVADASRLQARVAEVARLLALEPLALPLPSGRRVRGKGYWTHDSLCRAVAEVACTVGGFPTHAQLSAAGYGHAAMLLRAPGMRQRVAAAIGWPLRHERGIWSEEEVIAQHAAFVVQHGRYPTRPDLAASGRPALDSARRRLFAGRQGELRARVEQRCGLTLPRRVAPPGSYATLDQLASLLRPLCDRLGRFPTAAEMTASLPATVYSEVSRRVGLQKMAEHMGVSYAGPLQLTRGEALALFRGVLGKPDLFAWSTGRPHLTTTQITAALGSRGIGIMQRHFGGMAALRAALHEGDGTGLGGGKDTARNVPGE